jgi:hypothetical protein
MRKREKEIGSDTLRTVGNKLHKINKTTNRKNTDEHEDP